MRPLDAGYPRLYRATSLDISPLGDNAVGFVAAGAYHDERGLRVGQFVVTAPADGRWGDRAASRVTEIRDGDSIVFMEVVHRDREYVIADPDGTELATLRPRAQVLGSRLVVRITLAGAGEGLLRERRRHARGARGYDVVFGASTTATITCRFVGNGLAGITLVHDPGASPPQRCAAMALATCLPQISLPAGPGMGPTLG